MSKTHNKKRNIGIIFEQLILYVSDAIINDDRKKAANAVSVIRKHFKEGKELYKEFRLFNALIKTRVPNEALAVKILSEAKDASRNFNAQILRREKSLLIKDINYQLNDSTFYARRVNEYKNYATIQTLLNDWRKGHNADLSRVINYETEVTKWLMSEINIENNFKLGSEEGIDALTVRIMTEKFNEKYGKLLGKEQRDLINEHVFNSNERSHTQYHSKLLRIKKDTLAELKYLSDKCDNQILNEKIDSVIKRVSDLNLVTLTDETVSRFLTLSKLKNELMDGEY